VEYQTYDVAQLLDRGQNAIAALVGDGKFRGKLGLTSARNVYGDRTALLVQIEVDLEDGSSSVFGTDQTWRSSTGAVLASDPKDGEVYDARLFEAGWDRPGFDDRSWALVRRADPDTARMVAPTAPPVTRRERLRPTLLTTPDGSRVLDFGQNFFGRVRFRVKGPSGISIVLEHGETLDEDGNFTMKNLHFPPFDRLLTREKYMLRGSSQGKVYEPHFANHGFRYVPRLVGPLTRFWGPRDLSGRHGGRC
jgi:alpha-L-rhamnosidase